MGTIQNGLIPDVRAQRSALFGPNSLDIKGKSAVSLLIDEVSEPTQCILSDHLRDASLQVIHPFYIFQIASIVLWSLDDYYYYAFCIALISIVSIVTTLIDTKKVESLTCLRRTVKLTFVFVDNRTHEGDVTILMPGKRAHRWRM